MIIMSRKRLKKQKRYKKKMEDIRKVYFRCTNCNSMGLREPNSVYSKCIGIIYSDSLLLSDALIN